MKDLQTLVYKFMEREEITLKQALLQSSLGMCAKTGDVAELVRGVVYNGYPYTDERKKRNTEYLGEILFYWIMLASTTGSSPEEIMQEYIASYIQRTKIMKDDEFKALVREKNLKEGQAQSQASILEMLKYIKDNEAQTQTHSSLSEVGKYFKTQEHIK